MLIGDRIRQLRHEKDMSMEALSKSTGIAMASLCRIEKNKMAGSLKSHIKICKALDITLPALYSSQTPVSLSKKDKQSNSYLGSDNISVEILTTDACNRKMMPMLIKLKPGCSTSKERSAKYAEKLVYVMGGELEVNIDSGAYSLAKGDNFYLNASTPHFFKNIGKTDVRMLSIICPAA